MYVLFSLDTGFRCKDNGVRYPRWNMRVFDKDIFEAVINLRLACVNEVADMDSVCRARWLTSTISMACDCASKRTHGNNSNRSKYW